MIKPAEAFLTKTLREKPWGINVTRILSASLAAVDPAVALEQTLQRNGNTLVVPGQKINLDDFENVYLLAIGKAGIPMAVAAADLIADRLSGGLVLSKSIGSGIPDRFHERIRLYHGGHPIPNQDSLKSAGEILSYYSNMNKEDLIIILISGGGSALFTSPAPGISLTDIQQANQVFLDHGLDIQEINTIRKHISQAKGGQLAGLLHPARTITLILSDVIGDPMDMIASGPTVPDPSTFQDAQVIINKYQLEEHLPTAIKKHLKAGVDRTIPETPKPGDPVFQGQTSLVIAGIQNAIKGGIEQAQEAGFRSQILPDPLSGEAKLVGVRLAELICQTSISDAQIPVCLIAGGETTVTLTDSKKPGKGGRNLELALSAVRPLAGRNDLALVTLATDGEDGITDAAGAIVTGETLERAEELGLNPDEFLANHDSYSFFQALDDLLLPGVTGTNVNDLCFLFTF